MAVLSWGKPTIQYADLSNGYPSQESDWHDFPVPVQGTTTLDTAEGDSVQALEEGGGVVDAYTNKSQFTLTFELFEKKGESQPIMDDDGVVIKNYAIRLIPEDPTCTGFEMAKVSMTYRHTWNAADGGRHVYTATALVPDDKGKMLRPYIKQS